MNKFRKKPVVIEAFQMTEVYSFDNSEWPEWLNKAWQKGRGDEGALWLAPSMDERQLFIGTKEGSHQVTWGDWIIQGVKGELYPCKPDIFQATYDAME